MLIAGVPRWNELHTDEAAYFVKKLSTKYSQSERADAKKIYDNDMDVELVSGELKNMELEKCTEQIWSTFETPPELLFHTQNQLFESEFLDSIKAQVS